MAFFPKDEHVKRRGVAMRVKNYEGKVRVGDDRDKTMNTAAEHFEHGEFVLNRAMESSPSCISKVKTFKGDEVAAVKRHGNILAPKPEPYRPHVAKSHNALPTTVLESLQDTRCSEQRQRFQADVSSAAGLFEKFSQQPRDRMHKVVIAQPPKTDATFDGFNGLGKASPDVVQGRGHVPHSDYNPLNFRRKVPWEWACPERPRGIATVPPPVEVTVQEHFHYDDGVKLEELMKRRPIYAHVAHFEQNYGPDQDLPGFKGLGAADRPRGGKTGRAKSPDQMFYGGAVSPPGARIFDRGETTTNYMYHDPRTTSQAEHRVLIENRSRTSMLP